MWTEASRGYPHQMRPTARPHPEGAVTEQLYRAAGRMFPPPPQWGSLAPTGMGLRPDKGGRGRGSRTAVLRQVPASLALCDKAATPARGQQPNGK